MKKERLSNIPSGNDGNGYSTVGGEKVAVFKIRKLSPKLTGEVEKGNFLGERMSQHAMRRIEGTFSVSYCPTSYFIKMVRQWVETGVYPDITIQYYNELNDVHGRGEYQLRNCILKDLEMGMLDDESVAAIVHTTEGTFDDFDIISEMR